MVDDNTQDGELEDEAEADPDEAALDDLPEPKTDPVVEPDPNDADGEPAAGLEPS